MAGLFFYRLLLRFYVLIPFLGIIYKSLYLNYYLYLRDYRIYSRRGAEHAEKNDLLIK